MKKKIIFVSTNDGSDTRINKEIKSLSKKCEVIFLGVGCHGQNNFVKQFCEEFYLVSGKRNSISTIIKQLLLFIKLLFKQKVHSIHIVNEQLMMFFYPFLFFKHTVLDLFDSFFLKIDRPNDQFKFIKYLVYLPVNKILVTDKNRKNLMPDFIQNKIIVLENFPYLYKGSFEKKNENLTIFYFGSMTKSRGTEILKNLVNSYENVKVIMAGWINDQITKEFSNHKAVDFRGTISQEMASHIAAAEADYIMCCYEPNNSNNINASPNKIYDAIQTRTPVIINEEVKAHNFVKKNEIGIVINSFYNYNIDNFYKKMKDKKGNFSFSNEKLKTYSWEHIDNKLLKAHKLT